MNRAEIRLHIVTLAESCECALGAEVCAVERDDFRHAALLADTARVMSACAFWWSERLAECAE